MIAREKISLNAMRALILVLSGMLAIAQAHADEKKEPAEKHKIKTAAHYIDEGKRLRQTGRFMLSLEACRKAWNLDDPRGLLCTAYTLAHQGYAEAALHTVADLQSWLSKNSPANKLQKKLHEEAGREAGGLHTTLRIKLEREKQQEMARPQVQLVGARQSANGPMLLLRVTNPGDNSLTIGELNAPELERQAIEARVTWKQRKIAPGGSAEGVLSMNRPPSGHLNLQLQAEARGVPSLTHFGVIITTFAPEPDPRILHTTVNLHGLYGAIWLADDVDAPSKHKPTSMGGFAVRLQRGLRPWAAVEGEVAYAQTSEVQFETGAMRDARMIRAVGHGVMRTGVNNVKWFRLGLGLQVANHRRDKVGINTVLTVPLSFGIGYTRRIGKWSVGMEGTALGPLTGDEREVAVQAGLHVGYGSKW